MTQNEKPAGIPDEMSLRNLSNQGSLKAASKGLTVTGRKKPDVGLESFKFPSTDQMRREVETGVFSPESIAIANSILESAENIEDAVAASQHALKNPADWIHDSIDSTERLRRNAERKRIEAQKRDRSRMWREEATKSITPATAHFKQIATETKKTTKAFKKLAKAAPKKPEPGANLTHRPFLILSTIRDEFSE